MFTRSENRWHGGVGGERGFRGEFAAFAVFGAVAERAGVRVFRAVAEGAAVARSGQRPKVRRRSGRGGTRGGGGFAAVARHSRCSGRWPEVRPYELERRLRDGAEVWAMRREYVGK